MIVVCFPGGAGGHYTAWLIDRLLKGQSVDITAAANFHKLFRPAQSFLNFSFLDHSMHSLEEEMLYINQIQPRSNIVLGHFRNINAVYQHTGAKIVCICAGSNQDLLVARVLNEALSIMLTDIKYQDIRGEHWPKTYPGYNKLPRWNQLEIQSSLHRMFYNWNDQLILDQVPGSHLLTLTSDTVLTGDVVTPLSEFLQQPVLQGLIEIQQDYQKLIQLKYTELLAGHCQCGAFVETGTPGTVGLN